MVDRKHLLIIGAPRSGTTLLASMIGRHSEVAMLIEDLYGGITRLVSKSVLANKLCVPNQVELNKKATLRVRALQRLGFLRQHPISRFSIEDHLSLENPRILSIVRDGSHVISSIMRRGDQPFEIALARWVRAIEVIRTVCRDQPGRSMVVSYESLVSDPESNMRRVADFLDLSFEGEMLEGYRYNPIYKDETSIDPHRAQRDSKAVERIALDASVPDAMRMYRALCELSRGGR